MNHVYILLGGVEKVWNVHSKNRKRRNQHATWRLPRRSSVHLMTRSRANSLPLTSSWTVRSSCFQYQFYFSSMSYGKKYSVYSVYCTNLQTVGISLIILLFFKAMIWSVFWDPFTVSNPTFACKQTRKLNELETTMISDCTPENAKVQAGTLRSKSLIFLHFGLFDSEGFDMVQLLVCPNLDTLHKLRDVRPVSCWHIRRRFPGCSLLCRSCSPWSPRSSVPAPRRPAAAETSCSMSRSRMVRLKLDARLLKIVIAWYVWRSQTQWQT